MRKFILLIMVGGSLITGFSMTSDAQPVLTGTGRYFRSGGYAYYNSVSFSGRKQGYNYSSYSSYNNGAGYYWGSSSYYSKTVSHPYTSIYSRTGGLSFEFWGKTYYNGSTGYILRTRFLSPLYQGYAYIPAKASGVLRRINRYLWPQINLYHFTSSWGRSSYSNFSSSSLF